MGGRALSTTTSNGGVGRAPRGRQIGKTFNNIGIRSLSSQESDAVNQHLAEETTQILVEIRSNSDLGDAVILVSLLSKKAKLH